MAQPQRYDRTYDFGADEEGTFNGSAVNTELDRVSTSVNQLRDRQARLIRDDGTLAAGTVGLDALRPDAADSLTGAVDKKSQAAQTAASEAQDSADQAAADARAAHEALEQALEAKQKLEAEGQTQVDTVTNIASDPAVQLIGSDLRGELTEGDLDYGWIGDETEGVKLVDTSAIKTCAENIDAIKTAATAGAHAEEYAASAKAWAESSESPDGEADADSTTGKTRSAKTWALEARSRANEINTGALAKTETLNGYVDAIYSACDEFVKGV